MNDEGKKRVGWTPIQTLGSLIPLGWIDEQGEFHDNPEFAERVQTVRPHLSFSRDICGWIVGGIWHPNPAFIEPALPPDTPQYEQAIVDYQNSKEGK